MFCGNNGRFYMRGSLIISQFKKNYLFLERGEGREKERGRNISVWLPLTCPHTGDLARNPGMCPDRESNSDLLVCRLVINPLSHT